MPHLVVRPVLDVRLRTGGAADRAVLDRLGGAWHDRLVPVLGAAFDAADPGGAVRIDRLVLDLGAVAPGDLERGLADALRAALDRELPAALADARAASGGDGALGESPGLASHRVGPRAAPEADGAAPDRDAAPDGPDARRMDGEALATYLRTGRLPWWAAGADRFDVDDAVRAALADGRLAGLVPGPTALRRLAWQVSDATGRAVAAAWSPDGATLAAALDAWRPVAVAALDAATADAALRLALLSAARPEVATPTPPDLPTDETLSGRVAAAAIVALAEASGHDAAGWLRAPTRPGLPLPPALAALRLASGAKTTQAAASASLPAVAPETRDADIATDSLEAVPSPSGPPGTPPEAGDQPSAVDVEALSTEPTSTPSDAERETAAEPDVEAEIAARAATPPETVRPSAPTAGRPGRAETPGATPEPTTAPVPGAAPFPSRGAAADGVGGTPPLVGPHRADGPPPPRAPNAVRGATRAEEGTPSHARPATPPTADDVRRGLVAPPPPPADASGPGRPAEPAAAHTDPALDGEPIYVSDAGLVLLAPFLPHFLRALGLVAEGAFASPAAQRRAVSVVASLASGRERHAEPDLVLAKLLCGVPLAEPVEPEIVPTDAERAERTALLEAVVGHWTAVGRTSPEGLRATFLARDGRLDARDDAWHLTVERRGVDVLVDAVPWAVGVVALGWMPAPIHVTW